MGSHQRRSRQRREESAVPDGLQVRGVRAASLVREQELPRAFTDDGLTVHWVLARISHQHIGQMLWAAQDCGHAAFWPMDRTAKRFDPIMPSACFIGMLNTRYPADARDKFFGFVRDEGFVEHVPITEKQIVIDEPSMALFKHYLRLVNLGKPLPKELPFQVGDEVVQDIAGRALHAVITEIDPNKERDNIKIRLMESFFGGAHIVTTNQHALSIVQR
ncbi:MAG: hypothetical protein AAFR65_11110 [Pseudomonadota bacterium]